MPAEAGARSLSVAALKRDFEQAEPFPHFVVDEFLDAEFCEQLLAEFPPFAKRWRATSSGRPAAKRSTKPSRRSAPATRGLDAKLKSAEFLSWLSQATGIPDLLYDRDYVGGGTHENRDGQELDPHVDFNYHPTNRWHRRLNLILFLNKQWERSWGGSLQLHPDPWKDAPATTVVPLFNRCVVFETSERSWHGFPRIRLPEEHRGLTRKSIAVYFYSKERPADQIVPEHATYYVPRPLPDHLEAGRTLTEQDVADLKELIARRDRQLRYQWEHERELRQVFAETIASPSLRIGRTITWPLRKLRELFRG